MIKLLFIVIVLSTFIACDEKPKNPVAEYGDAMIDSYRKGQQAGKEGNLHAVRQAVKVYRAAHGKFPDTLEEAEELIGSEMDMSLYDYDPESGTVTLACD
jgi:hypothetical protein